jgi:hypothetical protein
MESINRSEKDQYIKNHVKIFIRLLGEGSFSARPTEAEPLGNDVFRVLATADYDPDTETWEFLPGSRVRLIKRSDERGEYLLAVKL